MKILIVDDHPIVRFGVSERIKAEWSDAIVEEADNISTAISAVARSVPDAIILDIVMPDISGTEGVTQMLRVARKVPILVHSMNTESAFAGRLLKMGVAGYLSKDAPPGELVTALRRVMDGNHYVTPSMGDYLVAVLGGRAGQGEPHDLLSTQEHRVMLLIAAGKAPAEIGELMHLSAKTVGTYRARIFDKMGWKNNVELTKYCIQHKLTDAS
ncbi:MAG: response regulator transcription factor [Caldimonas sp.]